MPEVREGAGASGLPFPLSVLVPFNNAILGVCRLVSMVLVAAIAVIVILAVIFRYGFNNSLAWAEDAAKFLMVWMTFIAAPLGFRHGAHVAVDLLPPGLTPLMHRIIRLAVHAIVLFVMVMLAWNGWRFAWNGRTQVALTIGDISMLWIFVCMPIGAAIMALVSLEQLLRVLCGVPETLDESDEQISTQGI
jgi:TRAP-type C4-dicarboxylate transport system permease small subunit